MARYIIRGGVEGKRRLEVLARVMWPTTARALQEAGLSPGMTCLSLGCGGGDVTLLIHKGTEFEAAGKVPASQAQV